LGIALSVLFALAVTWLALGVAYYSTFPIGFCVTTLAFGAYVVSVGGRRLARA
jgi:zinc/manganese transport system permease protein